MYSIFATLTLKIPFSCPEQVDTYNAKYPNGDLAQGGYSTGIRAHEKFVFPIPAELPLASVAPMLCAGITVFSPLIRNGAKPGARVGIVSILYIHHNMIYSRS